MPFTEKTIHVNHGKMYRVVTKRGLSIVVTDDHSLCTVSEPGSDSLFSPIGPVEAKDRLRVAVPSPFTLRSDKERRKIVPKQLRYAELDPGLLNDVLLSETPDELFKILAQAEFLRSTDDYQRHLLMHLLGRAGLLFTVYPNLIEWSAADSHDMIPQDGKLIQRSKARPGNPYKQLGLTWDWIRLIKEVPREPITYDFTVPDFPLFVANNILVYDTMTVHCPTTGEAVAEAWGKMRPSQNVFSARNGEPLAAPQQEAIMGMWLASQPSKAKPITLANVEQAKQMIREGKARPDNPCIFDNHRTTLGLAVVNSYLPDKYQDYTSKWDKKLIYALLSRIGKDKRELYVRAAEGIKDCGFEYSYLLGTSFKDTDFHLPELNRRRDIATKSAESSIRGIQSDASLSPKQQASKTIDVLTKLQTFNQGLTKDATGNTFNQWAYSGSKGSPSQVMQILASPTIVKDAQGKVVPIPIKHSYLQGITPSEFWVSSYGTRKGVIDVKLSIAPAGMLEKELVGNALDLVISMDDCGTTQGLKYPLSDARDLIGRFEAKTNHLVDATYIEAALKKGLTALTVRSPATCRAGEGVCRKCYGHNDNHQLPHIGDNVGVVSAQAIAEPLAQISLSSKHTAGTATADAIGLPQIQRFFTMPNQYAGAAVISQKSGVISKVEEHPAGGWKMHIGDTAHYVAAHLKPLFGVGDKVEAGNPLSSGVVNISHVVPHIGVEGARQMFVDQAHSMFNAAGASSMRKHFEVMARGLVNYVEITDPGDFADAYRPGEIVEYNKLVADLQRHPGKTPPKYVPRQRGTTYSPTLGTKNWLAQLGFKHLRKNLISAAARGDVADISSVHPTAAYVTGAKMNIHPGEDTGGRY